MNNDYWSAENIIKSIAGEGSIQNKNTKRKVTKMEMTVEQYRERMIEAFQNTGCEELIALVALPNEEAFKNLENDLRNCWPSWYKREADYGES